MFGDDPGTGVGTTADPTDHFADTNAEIARQAIVFGGQCPAGQREAVGHR